MCFVNDVAPKLPCGNTILKQVINLLKGAVPSLRNRVIC